jgi:D-arabinose 1-dehydrogenase-like Zn-dependent alcohol dehydrogenase
MHHAVQAKRATDVVQRRRSSSRSRPTTTERADLRDRPQRITIVGSIVGTRTDLREVFELHAAGRTRVIRETRSLEDINQAIADVEAGRVVARIVFTD